MSKNPNAAGLGINWQLFGSNGEVTADYSRGVLERFTRRAPKDWKLHSGSGGNITKKVIDNPRFIRYRINPHFAFYFEEKFAVNSNGDPIKPWYGNSPILTDKIVINHYRTKSKEEYEKKKIPKGDAATNMEHVMESFYEDDRNEEFDDGILKYRAACEENFSLESNFQRIHRVEKALIEILTQRSPFDVPEEFFNGKLEIFLTCRALAERLGTKIGSFSAEEYALVWIYQTLIKTLQMTRAEIQLFMSELPAILARPFPICKKIKRIILEFIIPTFCEALKNGDIFKSIYIADWKMRSDIMYIQKLLNLIK